MNNGRTFICILCNSRIPKCISISEMLTTSKFKRSKVDLSFRENDVQQAVQHGRLAASRRYTAFGRKSPVNFASAVCELRSAPTVPDSGTMPA